jgi:hypothetical protein
LKAAGQTVFLRIITLRVSVPLWLIFCRNMSPRNCLKKFFILSLLFHSSLSMAEPEWLLELEESLENRLLARLNTVQQGNPTAFTTDGCSGGMSEAWVFLGQALPKFT